MATVKQEMDAAADGCGITPPSSWLDGSQDSRTFNSILLSVVSDLLSRHDWRGARVVYTFSAVTDTALFSLPADFKRLQNSKDAIVEVNSAWRSIVPSNNDSEFERIKAGRLFNPDRVYRLTSVGIEFYPAISAGETVTMCYVGTGWLKNGASTWTNEATDESIFPDDLLRCGVAMRWKRQKGLPYAAEEAEYNRILSYSISADKPSRTINFGRKPIIDREYFVVGA